MHKIYSRKCVYYIDIGPNDPDGEYECSVYNVEIARVINGLYEKDTIEVKVIKEDEENNKFINVGEEYIMFLDTFETIPASLLNLQQATILTHRGNRTLKIQGPILLQRH